MLKWFKVDARNELAYVV
uniref:Uncharacterized protein n=1 Tax=Anguilla anguilla TaxID=7936 RepID=A0A0E9VTG7_ANGAN